MASTLRALGWDHPRCMQPMRACANAWARAGRGRIQWHTRSLEAFGDQPLEEIAADFDVLVIDHPFCGAAQHSGCLVPIEPLLDAGVLDEIERTAVGPSQRSYRYGGHVWALASDAACQVSACREDLLTGPMPTDWPAAVELVRSLGPRAALPLSPAHAISSLLTLWAGAGLEPLAGGRLVDPGAGLQQVEWLIEMHRCGRADSTRWEPPDALGALVDGQVAYVPLTYGYVNYSSALGCRFLDIPGVAGSVLGGAGLAVAAGSKHPHEAAAFAAWVCSPDVQYSIVAAEGGQPASGACWDAPVLDAESGLFYSGTRATIEAAWVRPRDPWWPRFQLEAGRAISAALEAGMPAVGMLDHLLAIHDQIALRSGALT